MIVGAASHSIMTNGCPPLCSNTVCVIPIFVLMPQTSSPLTRGYCGVTAMPITVQLSTDCLGKVR